MPTQWPRAAGGIRQAYAVWYSGGTTSGLYYAVLEASPVKLADAPGPKHSMLTLDGGKAIAAWDAPIEEAPASAQMGGGIAGT